MNRPEKIEKVELVLEDYVKISVFHKFTNLKTLTLINVGIHKIEAGDKGGSIEFSDNTSVDPLALVKLVQQQPDTFRLANGTRLRFDHESSDFEERHTFVNQLLEQISQQGTGVAA